MEQNSPEKTGRPRNGIAKKVMHIVGWALVGLSFAALFALVFGFLVKWIWNMLMPGLFGVTEITYWQAFGIVILAKLLFGGFGHHRHDHWDRGGKRHSHWSPPWRKCSDQDKGLKNKFNRWKYYEQFWKDEGKARFDEYVEKMEREKTGAESN